MREDWVSDELGNIFKQLLAVHPQEETMIII